MKADSLRILLAPLSWLYDLITSVRNWLYDSQILPQYKPTVKTICVGNLSVGGTGKTPHVAYLVELLQQAGYNQIAILSRGYRRQTKGYRLATPLSTAAEIGDEPMQQYRNYPNVHVAVCESRTVGLKRLAQDVENLQVVLLDDAFQHRAVKAGHTILLTTFDDLYVDDHLLPWGNLRENKRGAERADSIVITKSPIQLCEEQIKYLYKKLRIDNTRDLFFSHICYGLLCPGFPEVADMHACDFIDKPDFSAIVVTGIANPMPMLNYLKDKKINIKTKIFPDHYCFSEKDFVSLQNEMKLGGFDFLITTEKDMSKIRSIENFPEELKPKVFYLPISISFGKQSNLFNQKILDYVATR